MGLLKTLTMAEGLKSRECFHKWFIEIEDHLFQDLPTDIPDEVDDDDDDEEDLPFLKKQRIERVKKCIVYFSDSEILLELAEDTRNNTNFVAEHNPLEAFAVLGTIAFFNAYVHHNPEAEHLNTVIKFVEKYKSIKNANQEYIDGMESVLETLKMYDGQLPNVGVDRVKSCQEKENSAVLGIKLHFLQGFPDPLPQNIRQLLDHIIHIDSSNAEWNLQKYYITRLVRLTKFLQADSSKPVVADLNDERTVLASALRMNPGCPRSLLAKCQFLCDYLVCGGPPQVDLVDLKFATHSEILAFIRSSSETVTKDHPSFIRANFAFADIFSNQLPITRQDREYAKSLLNKALEANPKSSRINHKMGLFLIKSRQFSDAANYLHIAAQLNPHSAEPYQSLIKLLLRDPKYNREKIESFFNIDFPKAIELLGPENELQFWKGCYFFKIGESEPAINVWTETILEFYVTKPELDLETVLPFNKLTEVAKKFLWTKSNLTLEAVASAVKDVGSQEKTRRKVVFQRLHDLVCDSMKN